MSLWSTCPTLLLLHLALYQSPSLFYVLFTLSSSTTISSLSSLSSSLPPSPLSASFSHSSPPSLPSLPLSSPLSFGLQQTYFPEEAYSPTGTEDCQHCSSRTDFCSCQHRRLIVPVWEDLQRHCRQGHRWVWHIAHKDTGRRGTLSRDAEHSRTPTYLLAHRGGLCCADHHLTPDCPSPPPSRSGHLPAGYHIDSGSTGAVSCSHPYGHGEANHLRTEQAWSVWEELHCHSREGRRRTRYGDCVFTECVAEWCNGVTACVRMCVPCIHMCIHCLYVVSGIRTVVW